MSDRQTYQRIARALRDLAHWVRHSDDVWRIVQTEDWRHDVELADALENVANDLEGDWRGR